MRFKTKECPALSSEHARLTGAPAAAAAAANAAAQGEGEDRPFAEMNFYPPTNRLYCGKGEERGDGESKEREKPPLLVKCHGGPTGRCSSDLSLKINFFTSRGFAVADIDYRGSDGLGTSFRRSLRGQWGVADVYDCAAAVKHLSSLGLVDEKRCCISGGSAGGFTVLANLAFSDVFAAGASHYGIGDLGLLAEHTHKFESRYLDCLVGPLPQCAETYKERSPIYSVDKVSSPLVLFQGTEDKVVPPNQADTFYAAMRGKGLPAALVCFEGEQHGFRKAANVRRCLDGELSFFATCFGFREHRDKDFEADYGAKGPVAVNEKVSIPF